MHVGIVKLITMLLTQLEAVITKIMTSFRRKCYYLMTGNLVIFGSEEVANSASLMMIIAPSLFSTLERRVPLRRAMTRQDLSNSVIPGRRGPVDRSNTCVS